MGPRYNDPGRLIETLKNRDLKRDSFYSEIIPTMSAKMEFLKIFLAFSLIRFKKECQAQPVLTVYGGTVPRTQLANMSSNPILGNFICSNIEIRQDFILKGLEFYTSSKQSAEPYIGVKKLNNYF